MEKVQDYQRRHLEAIHHFYSNKQKTDRTDVNLTEIVLSWFTDGHAEKFRDEYLKNQSVLS